MYRKSTAVAVLACLAAITGCVDRRFVVTTNVPGAQIFIDGKPLGPSPVDAPFLYAGNYTATALAPGYEPLHETVRLSPKWYMYPPFDLIVETLYPGRIEDVRRVTLTLTPKRQLSDEELIAQAERLRSEGRALPPTRFPDKPPATPVGVPGVGAAPVSPGPVLAPEAPASPGASTSSRRTDWGGSHGPSDATSVTSRRSQTSCSFHGQIASAITT